MTRGKDEVIAELKKLGVTQSESALKRKSVEKLEEMAVELKNKKKVSEQGTAETVEGKTEHKEPPRRGTPKEVVVAETKYQLNIFTEFIYHLKYDGAKVLVENLGGGDVYVDSQPVFVGNKEKRLMTGDSVVLEGAKVLYLIAASQPEVKITELK